MAFQNKYILLPILSAMAACLIASGNTALCQEKTVPKKIEVKEEKAKQPVKSEDQILRERMQALENESKGLAEIADKLKKGETVKKDEIKKVWTPSAVFLMKDKDPVKELDVIEGSKNIAEKMLNEKNLEEKELQYRKSQIEEGQSLRLIDIEDPSDYGIFRRLKELSKDEEEIEKLRAEYEKACEANRFTNAADLSKSLDQIDDSVLKSDLNVDRKNSPWIHERLTPNDDDLVKGTELPAVEKKKDPAVEIEEPSKVDPDELKVGMGVDLYALGEAFYRSRDYKNALRAFKKVDHATHAQGDRILYMIGRSQERLGDIAAAKNKTAEAEVSYRTARTSYAEVGKNYPESFWAKRTDFSIASVAWKMELGPILGAPSEAYSAIRSQKLAKNAKKSGDN